MVHVYVLTFNDVEFYFKLEFNNHFEADLKITELLKILKTRDAETTILKTENEYTREEITNYFLNWQLGIIKVSLLEMSKKALKDDLKIKSLIKRLSSKKHLK